MSYELFEPYVLPRLVGRPSWDSNYGRDEFGIYADLTVDDVLQRFRLIKPGTFLMGSPEDEPGRFDDETQHEVTITESFWIGDSPVTREFWEEVMGKNPSHFKGPQNPVEQVSWHDCADFCSKLQGLFPGTMFRLPTGKEWEYSCRAGTTGATYAEFLGCEIGDIAWHSRNSNRQTHPVKKKLPNPWGLYDMFGNVSERCFNSEDSEDSEDSVKKNGRTCRGWSWFDHVFQMRAARQRRVRDFDDCSILRGLRLVIGS